MDYLSAFFSDYMTARNKFRAAASSLGFHQIAYPINQTTPTGKELTVDVACSNALSSGLAIVISGGLHGVEDIHGLSIQLALQESYRNIVSLSGTKMELVHALNPYGFAWLRRWNEYSIDLNHNFLLSEEAFEGSPMNYLKFDSLFARVNR